MPVIVRDPSFVLQTGNFFSRRAFKDEVIEKDTPAEQVALEFGQFGGRRQERAMTPPAA